MSIVRNKKREINYQTMYQKVSVRKIMRTVNVKGESTVNGSKCTMERTSPWPCTITNPICIFNVDGSCNLAGDITCYT